MLSGAAQMDVGAGRAANKSLRCGLQESVEHFKSSGDIHSLCEAADGQDCKEGQAADLWQSVEAQHSTLDLTQTRGDFLAPPRRTSLLRAKRLKLALSSPHRRDWCYGASCSGLQNLATS